MKTTKYVIIGLVIVLLAAGVVSAQELVIYPAKGQSNEQMEKDKYECYTWAKPPCRCQKPLSLRPSRSPKKAV